MQQSILRKIVKDKLALVSAVSVALLAIVSILGYLITPDQTRYANRQMLEIADQPMFTTILFFSPLPQVDEENFLQTMLFGKSTQTELIPIKSINIQDTLVFLNLLETAASDSSTKMISLKLDVPISEELLKEKGYLTKKTFWLGTDRYGRDVLSRLIIGARLSLSVGFVAVLISLSIGIVMGSFAGYFGGWIDNLLTWVMNVVWVIPTTLLTIAISLALGKGVWQIFVAIGVTMWVDVARLVRGQILSFKEKEFVEAAKALGFSHFRIIFKHILPNVFNPVLVIATVNFASAILIESGLSFLGMGAQPPIPSWGNMLRDNYAYLILGMPHLALVPGLTIMWVVLAFTIISQKLKK